MELRHRAPAYGSCVYNVPVIRHLVMMSFLGFSSGEVFCGRNNPLTDEHIKFCYGLTAYCCGYMESQCCWDSIWKVWWFWVVVLVVLGALFSCLGYLCTCVNDDRYNGGRVSPFVTIRDTFRRRWSNGGSFSSDEAWKNYTERSVLLPPYYPSTSTIALSETASHSAYPDPPPPYVEEVTTTVSETASSLPVATTTTVLTTTAMVHSLPSASLTTMAYPSSSS